jgi:hypothetical protein
MKTLAQELVKHDSHIESVLHHVPTAALLLSVDGPSPLWRVVFAHKDGAVAVISEATTWEQAGHPTCDAAWEDAAKRVAAVYGKTPGQLKDSERWKAWRRAIMKPAIRFNASRTRENWQHQPRSDESGLL